MTAYDDWRWTRWGIRLIFWSAVVEFLAILATHATMFVPIDWNAHRPLAFYLATAFNLAIVVAGLGTLLGALICLATPDPTSRNDMITFFATLVLMGALAAGFLWHFFNCRTGPCASDVRSIVERTGIVGGVLVVSSLIALVMCVTSWFFYFIDVANAHDATWVENLGWISMSSSLVFAAAALALPIWFDLDKRLDASTKLYLKNSLAIAGNLISQGTFVLLTGSLVATLKAADD